MASFYLLKWSISIIPFQDNNVNLLKSSYTSVDEETDERRDNRNRFYEHRGFELKFSDETQKERIFKKMGNLNQVGC
ncbi:hypothetical protein [Enterocloster clostridioformis]|uniref:hypothetical protein n=1 Tax=Enterocloster clostridioformis TaxID=1531 RepID=UPI0004813A39|nr:hypothetical protein [Enterocloster clostridioformis]